MSLIRTGFGNAINDFHRARQRAALERIFGRLSGRSVELLAYDEVVSQLQKTSQIERGVREIPVDAIVGSVGRYTDFSRTFLPRVAEDALRWASVASAAEHLSLLPPIEVYQIGEAYFVLDGNHRVSVARQRGISFIDALVTEVQTVVPFSPEDQPDELIVKSERATFLVSTWLNELRPGADLTVSVPGQYAHLENHIEVHRYFHEVEEAIELTDEEAVCNWYDEAYIPMVEAIREQGILRYFPGRTETDFYVWLATHQATLQNELGWQISPETAVAKLAAGFEVKSDLGAAKLPAKILDIVVPDKWKRTPPKGPWSHVKAMARYSDRLFSTILVPVTDQADSWPTVDQALAVAGRERAQLLGLHVMEDAARSKSAEMQRLRHAFQQCCQAANVVGNLALEVGGLIEKTNERVALADLLVVPRSFSDKDNRSKSPDVDLQKVIRNCVRPVLVLPGKAADMERILLAYDGKSKANEALFLAAYLAEQWQVELVVVTVAESRQESGPALNHAQKYLEMHEVEATFVSREGPVATTIIQEAADHQSDVILIGGQNDSLFGRRGSRDTLQQLLMNCQRPLLICP